jgi:hypothetical protein
MRHSTPEEYLLWSPVVGKMQKVSCKTSGSDGDALSGYTSLLDSLITVFHSQLILVIVVSEQGHSCF